MIAFYGLTHAQFIQLPHPESNLPTGNSEIKLDSIFCYKHIKEDSTYFRKTIYSYYNDNIAGKDTTTTLSHWLTDTKEFREFEINFASYNLNEILIQSSTKSKFNLSNQDASWVEEVDDYEYNSNNLIINKTHSWLYKNVLQESKKEEYIYEEDLLSKVNYSEKYQEESWNPTKKEEYEYLENNLLLSKSTSHYYPESDNWKMSDSLHYEYNESGQVILVEYKYIDSDIERVIKYEYDYDSFNNLCKMLTKKLIDGEWIIVDKTIHQYNTNNLLIYSASIHPNPETGEAISGISFSYSWDSQNNITEYTIKMKSGANQEWYTDLHSTYTYEGELLINSEHSRWYPDNSQGLKAIREYYYTEEGYIKLIDAKFWDMENEEWETKYTTHYHYSKQDLTSREEHKAIEAIPFYPNPSKGSIKFENNSETQSTLCVYNQSGQIVKRVLLAPFQSKIDFYNLKNGLYHITIENQQTIKKGKLMILK